MSEPLVSVFMMTYNHERFIEKAIESVIMQQINFVIEIVIGEDCSTDNTREIVLSYARKYPDLFNIILHEENVGAVRNQLAVFEKCTGKYIAMLEGDDYWTDPYKLQKQVDFLEANPDYGLVHTDTDNYFNNRRLFLKNRKKVYKIVVPDGDVCEKLIFNNFVSTCTVLVRTDLMNKVNNYSKSCIQEGLFIDYYLWLYISLFTKFKYLDYSTACYRVLDESISHSKNRIKMYEFALKVNKIRFYFDKEFLNSKYEFQFHLDKAKIDMDYGLLLRDKILFKEGYSCKERYSTPSCHDKLIKFIVEVKIINSFYVELRSIKKKVFNITRIMYEKYF